MLLGLAGEFQGHVLGSLVFRLRRPSAAAKKKLPFHRFKKGEGIILLRLGPDGETPHIVSFP